MPLSSTLNPSLRQAQQQERVRDAEDHPSLISEIGLSIADTWHRSSESARRASPTWIPTVIAPKPLAAVGCAVCTNAVLFATRIAVPTLAVPSMGVHVGVTLTALAFGWFVIDHRFAALGSLVGAAVGVSIVAAYGITSLPLSLAIVFVLAAGFGGALGSSCDEDVIEESRTSVPLSNDEIRPARSDTSTESESSRLQTRSATALSTDAPAGDGPNNPEDSGTALLMRLRTKLEQIDGPYAIRLKAKGLRILDEVEGIQFSENRTGTMVWLKKFEKFVETHSDVPPMTPIEISGFNEALEQNLRGLWGNERVKLMARRCAASQQRGSGRTTYAVVVGGSGTGKNRFLSTMRKAYPVSQTILLSEMERKDFAGFAQTFIDSKPAIATLLLMEAPRSICLLHIDEIDKASVENQRALLSLLAPENEVIDGYFGLPINKKRLFVICTMESTDNEEKKLVPELWSRLKNHVVVLNNPTSAGLQAIAEIALDECAEEKGMSPIAPIDRARVAAELALRCSAGGVGRDVSENVALVVDHAALLEATLGVPTRFTPSLVLRALDETWTSERFEVRKRQPQSIPFFGADRKKRIECLTLFAVLNSKSRNLRWQHDLQDGRVITVDMSIDKDISATVTSADGLSAESALSVNLDYLQFTPVEPNEFLSAEKIEAMDLPTRLRSLGPLEFDANGCQPDLGGCCIQLEEDRWLLALPLVLTDTSVTLNKLLKKSLSLGYDDDATRRRDELDAEMKRVEHFANDW